MTNPNIRASVNNWALFSTWKFDREGPEEYFRRQIMYFTSWIYERVHFGLMGVYVWGSWPGSGQVQHDDLDHHKRHDRDVVDYYLCTSRDGDTWD